MQKPTLSTALSIFSANAPLTMTLKEITDLLKVRHDKAMIKVAEMAESPDFGQVSKTDTCYSKGNNATGTTTTFLLDKRQSIAVAAALNTSLLMRIIDRWQELEGAAPKPLSQIEQVRLLLESLEANERLNDLIAKGKFVTCTQMRVKYPWAKHWWKGLQDSCIRDGYNLDDLPKFAGEQGEIATSVIQPNMYPIEVYESYIADQWAGVSEERKQKIIRNGTQPEYIDIN